MARQNDNCFFTLLGLLVIGFLILKETFEGNFIPILVIGAIILIFKLFTWFHSTKEVNETEQAPIIGNDFNYKPYLLAAIVLAGVFTNIYFNRENRVSNSNYEVAIPQESPIVKEPTQIVQPLKDTIKHITLKNYELYNCNFQLPDNLVYNENISTEKSKNFTDFNSDFGVTVNADRLDENAELRSSEDFRSNMYEYGKIFTENLRKNFSDVMLDSYEMSTLGNVEAFKTEQTSTIVSGKGITMKIITYNIISNQYYYTISFVYPKNQNFDLTNLEIINKSFNFVINESNTNRKTSEKYIILRIPEGKVYFYSNPDENYRLTSYFIGGEIIQIEEIIGEFGYVIYTNPRGITTKGWVNLKYVAKLI